MTSSNFNLKSFLNTLKLSEYLHILIDNGYDDEEKFMKLTEKELRKMGVKAAHINIIGKAIAKRRAQKGETGDVKLLQSVGDEEREEWVCDQCTLINKPKADKCAVCTSPRPAMICDQAELLENLLEVLVLPNEIVNIVCDYTLPRAPRLHEDDFPTPRKLEAMVEWLRKGGAVFPDLHLKSDPSDLYSGISGYAKKPLTPHTVVLEIPVQYLITEEIAKASEIGQKISKSGCRLHSDHSWLAAFLLQERINPGSFWKPYIECLPQRLHHVPIFFTKEEKQWLQGSFTLRMLDPRIRSLEAEYENIVKHVPEFSIFSVQEFMWARVIVITRCIGLQIGHRHTQCLAGIGDALGHKGLDSATEWDYKNNRNSFVITVKDHLPKNAPIYISFGRKCNSRFFVNYGMALDFNQDNQVQIFLKQYPLPSDPNFTTKRGMIQSMNKNVWQIAFEHKERITKRCMSFLRICLATEEELKQIQKIFETQHGTMIPPLNVHNEARILKAVALACAEARQQFETTIAEDNDLLNSPASLNHRNSIIMRRGEKEVLEAYIDLAKHIETVENFTESQLDDYLNQVIFVSSTIRTILWRREKYFEEIWLPLVTGQQVYLEEWNNSLEG